MNEHIGIVSGGFDPLHKGHLRMINIAKSLSTKLIVIVNSDQFLLDKKGYHFQDLEERKEIIRGLGAVDYAVGSIDTDQTVCKTLEVLSDLFNQDQLTFYNGGDRTESNIAEDEVCKRCGIEMVFGTGGGKVQSSSELVKKFKS